MIYSGFVFQPILFKPIWKLLNKHLKFNQKEEPESYNGNYLPCSISYYSPTIHSIQNSQADSSALFIFFWIWIQEKIPDPQHINYLCVFCQVEAKFLSCGDGKHVSSFFVVSLIGTCVTFLLFAFFSCQRAIATGALGATLHCRYWG